MSQRDDTPTDNDAPETQASEANEASEAAGGASADASTSDPASSESPPPVTGPEVVTPEVDDPVDPAPAVEVLPDETERLRRQLEESSARLRAVSKAYKDLQTEMDAFRRRQQVLAEAKAEKRAGEVVERFFEPVQNLRRAVEQKDVANVEDLRQGVQMALKQFVDRMAALGLKEIPGKGAPFDPKVHDALAQMPVQDPDLNGKVIEVYATGWQVGERVIQPAQVVVGVYQEPAEA